MNITGYEIKPKVKTSAKDVPDGIPYRAFNGSIFMNMRAYLGGDNAKVSRLLVNLKDNSVFNLDYGENGSIEVEIIYHDHNLVLEKE